MRSKTRLRNLVSRRLASAAVSIVTCAVAPTAALLGLYRTAGAAPGDLPRVTSIPDTTPAVRAAPPAHGAGATPTPEPRDYSDGPAMLGLRHWNHLPVRVYFVSGGPTTPARIRAALAGIDEWGKASRGVLCFALTTKASGADVTVRFVNAATVRSTVAGRVGETHTVTEGNEMVHADIRIAVGAATGDQITEDAAHEFGHALGISGHSDDPHDLMYRATTRYYVDGVPVTRPMRTVTARDLNTIRKAYPIQFERAGVP